MNESFSDMTGLAARQYLLDESKSFYNKIHVVADKITWTIGESIFPFSFFSNSALRYIDHPSKDFLSAECLDKKLAQKHQGMCSISYSELLERARWFTKDEVEFQSVVVHTAGGIYNRAFYLLTKEYGNKGAYQIMIDANINYWTPVTDFKTGACGVIHAAHDLNLETAPVKAAFLKGGVDISGCAN